MTPTVQHVAETITHARHQAPTLIADGWWVHNWAYLPTRHDPDRPTRAVPLDPTDPDATPGDRWALGLATDRAVTAYAAAGELVTTAARLAADATFLTLDRRPPLAPAPWSASGETFGQQVHLALRRLTAIENWGLARLGSDALCITWSAANHLLSARVELATAMPARGDKRPTSAQCCRTCREPHTEPGRTERSECLACRVYRHRTGKARPYRRLAGALEAKDRRLQRQEDQGEESGGVQAGTYRDGTWIDSPGSRGA